MNAKTIVRRSIQFLILLALVVPALSARAWNNVGHRTIAELTWRQLDKNERRAISDLLKEHPHYKEYLIADVPEGVDKDEWAFLKAAIWPDWVRPARHGKLAQPNRITKYDVYPHALGLPFLKPGDTNVALLKNFFIAKPDAAMVLSNSMSTLRNPNISAQDRAVSLCWTLHLMGDLHQPLHCASMVSEERKGWDGLGGYYEVIDPRGKKPERTNLHVFWDQLQGTEATYAKFAALADKISSDPKLKPAAMKEYRDDKTVMSWVREGWQIAVNFAYATNRVQYAHSDDLKSGKISESAIPVLKADYIRDAKKIADRRIALAGQRLADELKRDF